MKKSRFSEVGTGMMSLLLSWPFWLQVGLAQTPPITSTGLNTVITTAANTHAITGGARPAGGSNLFHSFGAFSVPTNHTANFLNDSGIETSNILGRVTGDNPSAIFGKIQTTGFDNANLFLMNPNGIVFGPNASLDVGGSVTFTTANYLRLAEISGAAGVFHTDTMVSSILTSAPVTAFGFLTSTPPAIAVQGSRLSVSHGEALSIVGGSQGFDYVNPDTRANATVPAGVTITGGKLSASSGEINIVSVASRGEISAVNFPPTAGMTMGNISLSGSTLLDVSADGAGTVRIRAGQLVMNQATISADTMDSNGSPVAIDINLTGDLSISSAAVPALTARTKGTGDAGKMELTAQNVNMTATGFEDSSPFSVIDSHSSAVGKAGDVSITATENISLIGDSSSFVFAIEAGTIGPDGGHGGNVALNATNVESKFAQIDTGQFLAVSSFEEANGSGGNLTVNASSLKLTNSFFVTDGFFGGNGGDLTISAHDVEITQGSALSASGFLRGGTIQITADTLRVSESQFETNTGSETGRGIIFTGKVGEFINGSTIQSSANAEGIAGPITFTATQSLTFADSTEFDFAPIRPSGLFTTAISGTGNAAEITINTPLLQLSGGARFDATTRTLGNGGRIVVNADTISISGERPFPISEGPLFGLVTSLTSGIYSRTIQSRFCSGGCGAAGRISVTTGSLSLNQGGRIDSNSTSAGKGGEISINASQIAMAGTTPDGSPSGMFTTASATGAGGNISLTAGRSVTLQEGASISASSTGPADAGNISINAGQQLNIEKGKITTEAIQSKAGNINIQAIDQVRVVNGEISTSVRSGAGRGGDITIDPKTVILQDGTKVFAQAVQGSGGNITITTPLYLKDSTSNVNADSQFGLNGSVTIQSPTSNLSGTVGQLASKTNPPQVLLQNRCIALAGGEQSTFILAGRDALPSEPGGWLSSPVAMEHWTGEETEEHVSGLMVRSYGWDNQPLLVMSKDETTVLSLRRLTPPGFLVRSFAGHAPTGCSS